jgi:hypothetical protein
MNAFSFKNAYLKCIGEQLRDALNDQGRLGIIYKGLTKFILAKYDGSTILTTITTAACLHSPITLTIALLNDNKVHVHNFDQTFYTTSTSLENEWTNRQHILTSLQQTNTQKLLQKLYTFNIYTLNDLVMEDSITLINPNHFKKQYNSCSKNIKTALYHSQIMFCQPGECTTNCPQPYNKTHTSNNLLPQYHTIYPTIHKLKLINKSKSSKTNTYVQTYIHKTKHIPNTTNPRQ